MQVPPRRDGRRTATDWWSCGHTGALTWCAAAAHPLQAEGRAAVVYGTPFSLNTYPAIAVDENDNESTPATIVISDN